MASRTGDQRFIAAPSARGAGAGLCLALALAALALGGCGGGSSDPREAKSTASSAAAAQGGTGAAGTAAGAQGQGQEKGQERGAGEQAKGRPAPGAAPGGQGGQGHATRIAQPKGTREQAPTPAEIAEATVADISLTSPSLPPGTEGLAPLAGAYTCDGPDRWPALSWSGVPGGTAELILYAMNLAPVNGRLFVDWAVAGLDPALSGIEAGKLPKGAIVGTNGAGKRGYEICPEGSETYLFALYALPRALSPSPGFDARELRKRILDVSGNVGLYPATYTRG